MNNLWKWQIMLFQPRQLPPFLSVPNVVFIGTSRWCWWLWKEPVCCDETRMQTWRWTELLQMLNVTTIGSHSHVGSQALGEVRHYLVDVFLWKLFPDGLKGNFQLISRLRLRLGIILLAQHGAPDVIVQRIQIWRVSMNPRKFACSKFCMTLDTLRNWGLSSLKEHDFVIFRHVLNKTLQ